MSVETPSSKRIWSRDSLRQRLAALATPARSARPRTCRLDNKRPRKQPSSTESALDIQRCRSFRWVDLPNDILQALMDLLPTFQSRAILQRTCSLALRLDRNAAAPRLDTFLDCEHMRFSSGTNVYLRSMQIGDGGARAVAQALQIPQYHAVVRLNLSDNGITDEGAESIAAALTTSPARLKRIYLDNNRISDSGARALMNAAVAHGHGTLVELDLRSNLLTEPGMSEMNMCKNQASNQSFTSVFLNWQLPSSTYMVDVQKDINDRMRCILVDWMFDVVQKLSQRSDSDLSPRFFFAVSCLDRYLSQRLVEKRILQLVGTACLLVAFHVGEGWASECRQVDALAARLSYFTDHSCSPDGIKECANDIRNLLLPELQQPTVLDFLFRYLTWTGYGQETLHLGEYLLTLAVLSYPLLQHGPDVVAAAAVLLTRDALEGRLQDSPNKWQKRLLRCSGVHVTRDLIPCAEKLADLHESIYMGRSSLCGHNGIGKLIAPKVYSWKKFLCVAKVKPTRPSLLRSPTTTPPSGVSLSAKLLMNSDDWTLYGAKRRQIAY